NYDVAVEYLDSAADILPISYKSQLDLGFSYRRLKQYELAKLHYQKAIALNPYVAESWFGLGVVAEETDGIESAIPYYQKAVTINPYSHPRSHAALARMYHQQFDYETAASILQKAVTDYYPINGNYRQMETVFKSTSFNTEVVNLYAYYAEVLILLGQKEDAQHFLSIAQDLDPNNLRVKLVESLISL
ncbi:tetratricopeptide repeat protein, partial [candidate division WWE3 bacterium]|nr:tetratricopeptide repeat protein [candidate division WWE3 bacterium]